MAQRPIAGAPAAKSTMPTGYEDPKSQFDKRAATETKKAKELLNAVEKGRAQLESERKAYCETFKQHLIAYISDESIYAGTYLKTVQSVIKRLDELNGHYLQAIKHMQDVAMPALGYLPKRFETLKKSIKVAKQVKAEIPKIQDFEYERLENLKFALLHFFNAKMYLHAKALELYSQAYEGMRQISIKNEFASVGQNQLRQVLAANPQVVATPRGGGGSNSARAASPRTGNNSGRQDSGERGQPQQQQQQQQPQRQGTSGAGQRQGSAQEAAARSQQQQQARPQSSGSGQGQASAQQQQQQRQQQREQQRQ